MPTVAGGGQQRCHAAVDGIEVHATGDQRAQQAQVRQHRGQHDQAAAIALAFRRGRMRVGTGLKQLQGAFDPTGTRSSVQLGHQSGGVGGHGCRQRLGWRCRFQTGSGEEFQLPGADRRRRSPLQAQVQPRLQQGHGRRHAPACRRRQQARPAQQQHPGQDRGHCASRGQARPTPGFLLRQVPPGDRQ